MSEATGWRLGIPLEGPHHHGADGAWGITAVLDRIVAVASDRGSSADAAGFCHPPQRPPLTEA